MQRCILLVVFILWAMLSPGFAKSLFSHQTTAKSKKVKPTASFDEYVAYFHQVFDIVEANYYVKPDPAKLDQFIIKFKNKIYPALAAEGKSDDYVRWRATWYLVDSLKTTEDKFSQFYPPKPAEKFQHEALGQRVDIGIEGDKKEEGFVISRIEPRSDAYEQGLREGDVITRFDERDVKDLDNTAVDKFLNPLINTQVKVSYFSADKIIKTVAITSKEYFKQTVFLRPVEVPGIICLEIPKFNRTSGSDLYRFLKLIQPYHPKGLVLDLRGNPGGPPLAAREISAFFLEGGEEFAYFQRRDQEKSDLDVPVIDDQFKFKGPIVILVNDQSGSAAELFAGIMQFRRRAIVLGETTAGQVLLKSMFPVDDGAMVALVTSLGYYPDGKTFGFKGITPDKIITGAPKEGLINLAGAMMMYGMTPSN